MAATKESQVLARKRALAPWLSDEKLRAGPPLTPNTIAAQRRASIEFRKLALWPKLPAARVASNLAAAKKGPSGSSGGGIEPNGGGEGGGGDTPNPKLHLITFAYYPQLDLTEYELWITDAPLEEWFTLFNAPLVVGAPWTPVHFGPPALDLGTSLQRYFVLRPGPPGDQGYFQCF